MFSARSLSNFEGVYTCLIIHVFILDTLIIVLDIKKENILHLDTPKKLNFLPNPINSNKDGEHNLEANSIEDF